MVNKAMVRAIRPTASSLLFSCRWSWAPLRHSQPEMAARGVMRRKQAMSHSRVRFSLRGPGSFNHWAMTKRTLGNGECTDIYLHSSSLTLIILFQHFFLSSSFSAFIFLSSYINTRLIVFKSLFWKIGITDATEDCFILERSNNIS